MALFRNIRRHNRLIVNWKSYDWLLFFVVIPLFLFGIYLLPYEIKKHLILFLNNPNLLSIFANHFTHSNLSQLSGNLIIYLLSMFVIFNFEINRKYFYQLSVLNFILLPYLSSIILINFLPFLPPAQGFSTIVSSLLGYIIYVVYSYLKNRFLYIKITFLFYLILLNFTILSILNQYQQLSIIIIILNILYIREIKNILNLAKELLNFLRELIKSDKLIFFYTIFLISVSLILMIILPFLIPSQINKNGAIINIISHYIGWAFGLFTPLIFTLDKFQKTIKKVKKKLDNNYLKILIFINGVLYAKTLNNLLTPQLFSMLFILIKNPRLYIQNITSIFSLLFITFRLTFGIISLLIIIKIFELEFYKHIKMFLYILAITFFYLAGKNIIEISLLYITEVEIGPFTVEGYIFPAKYTFKIFRSLFLGGLISIIEKGLDFYTRERARTFIIPSQPSEPPDELKEENQ